MGPAEFKIIMERLDRLESLLTGREPLPAPTVKKQLKPTLPEVPESPARQRLKEIQAEGHIILETQGLKAYKEFWQRQARKAQPGKRMLKR